MTRTAQCFCGSISLCVDGEPRMHAVCHCTDCQRRTGSAFGISVYFLRSGVTQMKGDPAAFAVRRRDDDQVSHFCKTCGTTLFWYSAARPHLIGIAGGCFPAGSLGEPTISAKHAEKLPWVRLPETWKIL